MFLGRESWVVKTMIPKLEAEFKLTYSFVSRKTGGSVEFLKRAHMIEPDYERMTIHSDGKHISTMINKFSRADGGKIPKPFRTPCVSSSSFVPGVSKSAAQ